MLDELVREGALVRIVDAWVNSLDMIQLGFAKAHAQTKGRPPYDPADLLKLYITGYLNGIRSSRALERECHRNVEVMWLLGRLAPDHKTIANFRKENPTPLVSISAAFIQFARHEGLIGGVVVAIDGSKIRAVASRKAIGTSIDLAQAQAAVTQQINAYLQTLDALDHDEAGETENKEAVRRSLERLRNQQTGLVIKAKELQDGRTTMFIQTETDARPMRSLHGAPGYNLQTAVDSESHLIVHHLVCNDASDISQLLPMAIETAAVLESHPAIAADAGYANGEQLQHVADAGLAAYVPAKRAVNNQGDGRLFDRGQFTYDPERDCYTCPADQIMQRKQISRKDKCVIYAARAEDCTACVYKSHCTTAKQRLVSRHLYETALEETASRMAATPDMMRLRRSTVEHPFATIKHEVLRNARLLMRGLQGARTELSLAVLAYNLKRVSNMKGNAWTIRALQA
jgi:transposase